MARLSVLVTVFASALSAAVATGTAFETDTFKTSGGDLKITFIGHASLIFDFGGRTIHVDPFGKLADYSKLPKADLILITHQHHDHLDPAAIGKIRTGKTMVIMSKSCSKKIKDGQVMANGDEKIVLGIKIQAVPAYNLLHKRPSGELYHPKGVGNGYVLSFGDKRVYVAGDTENIPEMKSLKAIDAAFLPMNLPYTMSPEMVADAAKAFKPKILYPYHSGGTDLSKIEALMKGVEGVELRFRKMNRKIRY